MELAILRALMSTLSQCPCELHGRFRMLFRPRASFTCGVCACRVVSHGRICCAYLGMLEDALGTLCHANSTPMSHVCVICVSVSLSRCGVLTTEGRYIHVLYRTEVATVHGGRHSRGVGQGKALLPQRFQLQLFSGL